MSRRESQLSIAFDSTSYRYFAPEIIGYAAILLQRIAPIFDDLDGEEERAAKDCMEYPGWSPDDYEAAIEAANDHARDAAIQLIEMKSVFLATGVSGLFHLFERQVYKHLNKELRDWLAKPINQWRDVEELVPKFRQRWQRDEEDLAFIQAFQHPDLIELRHVANAVKHGEGPAYKHLLSMDAQVVRPERLAEDWTVGPHSIFGVNLSVLPQDVERYKNGILEFWRLKGTYWADRSSFA